MFFAKIHHCNVFADVKKHIIASVTVDRRFRPSERTPTRSAQEHRPYGNACDSIFAMYLSMQSSL